MEEAKGEAVTKQHRCSNITVLRLATDGIISSAIKIRFVLCFLGYFCSLAFSLLPEMSLQIV